MLISFRVVSISLVFINKALLSGQSDGHTLDAPLFVTWFQCVVTVALCYMLAFGGKFFPSLGKFPELDLDYKTMVKVLLFFFIYFANYMLMSTATNLEVPIHFEF